MSEENNGKALSKQTRMERTGRTLPLTTVLSER